jgi:hypothetical protein
MTAVEGLLFRNCHAQLAPGTWPHVADLMHPRPLARRSSQAQLEDNLECEIAFASKYGGHPTADSSFSCFLRQILLL